MSTSRRPRSSPPPPLIPPSTLTLLSSLGHWKGQLVIFTLVLICGLVYFVVKEPIERWKRRRKEKRSNRARGALLALENKKNAVKEKEKEKERDRGRDKENELKKDKEENKKADVTSIGGSGKKRKGSSSNTLKLPTADSRVRNRSGSSTSTTGGEGSSSLSLTPLNARSLQPSPSPSLSVSTHPISTSRRRISSSASTNNQSAQPSSNPNLSREVSPRKPDIGLREPTDSGSNPTESTGIRGRPETISPKLLSAPSIAGPSRLSSSDQNSAEDQSDNGSNFSLEDDEESISTKLSSIEESRTSRNGDVDIGVENEDTTENGAKATGGVGGFSIIPDEGYLPPSALLNINKKKRKGKNKNLNGVNNLNLIGDSSNFSTTSSRSSVQNDNSSSSPSFSRDASPFRPPPPPSSFSSPSKTNFIQQTPIPESSTPTTPSTPFSPKSPNGAMSSHRRSHSRKTSLGGRPANMDLEELLTEREYTINTLRAEIGIAKAEEAKSRDDASKATKNEERVKVELEKARKGMGRSEAEHRRKEQELQRQLIQTTQLFTAQTTRLHILEQMFQSSGLQIPSPVPNMTFNHPPTFPRMASNTHSSSPSSPMGQAYPFPPPPPSPLGPIRSSSLGPGGLGSPHLSYPSPGAGPYSSSGGMLLHPQNYPHPPHLSPAPAPYPSHPANGILTSMQHSQESPISPGFPHPHPLRQTSQTLSPSSFKRSTTSTEKGFGTTDLAGPLTPGNFPQELGLGRPKSASGQSTGSNSSSGQQYPSINGTSATGGPYIGNMGGGIGGVADGSLSGLAVSAGAAGVGIGGSLDPQRRASIGSSVLKKKMDPVEGENVQEAIVEEEKEHKSEEEGTDDLKGLGGLGVGELGSVKSTFSGLVGNRSERTINQDMDVGKDEADDREGNDEEILDSTRSNSTSSHPTSPSPKPHLTTPASSDLLFGTSSPPTTGTQNIKPSTDVRIDIPAMDQLHSGNVFEMDGVVRCIGEDDGNVYYRHGHPTLLSHDNQNGDYYPVQLVNQGQGYMNGHTNPINNGHHITFRHQYGTSANLNNNGLGHHTSSVDGEAEAAEGQSKTGEGEKGENMEYIPMFASLAHTPEQLKEMSRMREAQLTKQRASSTSLPNGLEA